MNATHRITRNKACAASALLLGGLLAAGNAVAADEAPPPPSPPGAAGATGTPLPPPPPGARVERRIVVIDHDGEDDAGPGMPMGRGMDMRGRDIFIMTDGDGPGGRMMPGMGRDGPRMGGRGMRGAGMMRMARELGLTPEQRTRMRGIMEAARPKMEDLRGQIRVESRKVRDADPDAKGYDALVVASSKRIGELTAQMFQQRAQLRRQVWQLLTPEQRTKAEAMKAEAKKRRDARAERMERRARELRGAP